MTQLQDSPKVDVKSSLRPGTVIAWTYAGSDAEEQAEVRAWDDEAITTAHGRVPFSNPTLRLVDPAEKPRSQPMNRFITGLTTWPLQRILESPFNPRKTFPPATLIPLALNIAEHGLMDPLLCRPLEDPDCVELVDGARRRRAFLLLQEWTTMDPEQWPAEVCSWRDAHEFPSLQEVPVRIEEISDERARAIMWSTQEHREPLNPIDKAEAIRARYAQVESQRVVAAEFGLDQSAVSRALSLADLPEPVRQLGREMKLREGHLVKLLKWTKYPAICAAIGSEAAEQGASVRDLGSELPFHEDLKTKKLVRDCNSAKFDYRAAKRKYPEAFASPSSWQTYCLDLDLWKQLQAEAKAQEPVKPQGWPEGVVNLSQRSYGTYENLTYRDIPEGCSAACPCRARGCHHASIDPYPVCLDPARFKQLQIEAQQRVETARREQTQDLLDQITADVQERTEISTRDLLFLMGTPNCSRVRFAGEALGLDVSDCAPEGAAPVSPSDTSALLRRPPSELRSILVVCRGRMEQEERIRFDDGRHRGLEWYLGVETMVTAAEGEEGEEGEASSENCVRCHAAIPTAAVEALSEWLMESEEAFGDQKFRTWKDPEDPNGGDVLLTAKGVFYCSECSDSLRICRGCGCTEEAACEEGCAWLSEDLCTACAGEIPEADPQPQCVGCGTDLDLTTGLYSTYRDGKRCSLCLDCKKQELAAAAAGGAS